MVGDFQKESFYPTQWHMEKGQCSFLELGTTSQIPCLSWALEDREDGVEQRNAPGTGKQEELEQCSHHRERAGCSEALFGDHPGVNMTAV